MNDDQSFDCSEIPNLLNTAMKQIQEGLDLQAEALLIEWVLLRLQKIKRD